MKAPEITSEHIGRKVSYRNGEVFTLLGVHGDWAWVNSPVYEAGFIVRVTDLTLVPETVTVELSVDDVREMVRAWDLKPPRFTPKGFETACRKALDGREGK